MKKRKLVYGVGINNADYAVCEHITVIDENGKKKQKRIRMCPFYQKWADMLKRCYSEKRKEKYPTYKDCSVCQEWLTFSNFKEWMEKQDWSGKALDKDILFPGNKVYSAEKCVFISQKVNNFLTERQNDRGEWMIGVYWCKRGQKFQARCGDSKGKQQYLGVFDTELEAHKAWLDFKLKLAYQLAAEQTDLRIAKALIERYENYKID